MPHISHTNTFPSLKIHTISKILHPTTPHFRLTHTHTWGKPQRLPTLLRRSLTRYLLSIQSKRTSRERKNLGEEPFSSTQRVSSFPINNHFLALPLVPPGPAPEGNFIRGWSEIPNRQKKLSFSDIRFHSIHLGPLELRQTLLAFALLSNQTPPPATTANA